MLFRSLYKEQKTELGKLLREANRENDLWTNIIKKFNDRFYVPFKIEIKNQEDVILKQEVANLIFKYKDNDNEECEKERDTLLKILSKGERRAFFVLQFLFEIEARKTKNISTIIIYDDIAESFDYKNKYGIMEYILELNNNNHFRQIILTHNFDFYRNVSSRLDIGTDRKSVV